MWCYWKTAVLTHLNIVYGCKESTCKVGDLGSVPELGRFPGEGKGYPLQYSGLEKSMDSIVHGVSKIWTWLSNFHFHFLVKVGCFYPTIAKWNRAIQDCMALKTKYIYYLLFGPLWEKVHWSPEPKSHNPLDAKPELELRSSESWSSDLSLTSYQRRELKTQCL